MTTEGKSTEYSNLTESQKKSAYFNMQNAYDPIVYENTIGNYFKIVGMLLLFYTIMMLHWFGNYSLGIHFSETCTIYNIIVFAQALLVITAMLCYGRTVNAKKSEHEYYAVKISEAKIRQAEIQAKKNQAAALEAKMLAGK